MSTTDFAHAVDEYAKSAQRDEHFFPELQAKSIAKP
jgi:hypothetical protein